MSSISSPPPTSSASVGPINASAAENLSGEIQRLVEQLKAEVASFKDAVAALKAHRDSKKPPPDSDASDEAKAEYQTYLADFQAKEQQLLGKCNEIEQKIAQLEGEIAEKNGKMPEAMAKDAETVRKALESIRKDIEAQSQSGRRDGVDSEDGNAAIKKKLLQGQGRQLSSGLVDPPGSASGA